jgi:hypothetical protein
MLYEYPLTKANRIRLARAFYQTPRVDLSIACVVEGQMGAVFVDNVEQPTVFKIQSGPFVYFAGWPRRVARAGDYHARGVVDALGTGVAGSHQAAVWRTGGSI